MKRALLCLVFFLVAVPCFAGQKGQDDIEQVIYRLQQAAAAVRTVQSDFVQEKELSVFKQKLVSKGKMYLDKPDKLRWEYLEPRVSGFSVNGEKGRRWNEFNEEVQTVDVAGDVAMKIVAEQLLAWAKVDLGRLRGGFSIEVAAESPVKLLLKPTHARIQAYLKQIVITFAQDEKHITSVELQEKDGDSTRIYFENTVLNQGLDPALF